MQIKDLKITKCDKKDYPLTVNNVTVQFGSKPRVKVSGSLSTEVDLIGSIKVVLQLNGWI